MNAREFTPRDVRSVCFAAESGVAVEFPGSIRIVHDDTPSLSFAEVAAFARAIEACGRGETLIFAWADAFVGDVKDLAGLPRKTRHVKSLSLEVGSGDAVGDFTATLDMGVCGMHLEFNHDSPYFDEADALVIEIAQTWRPEIACFVNRGGASTFTEILCVVPGMREISVLLHSDSDDYGDEYGEFADAVMDYQGAETRVVPLDAEFARRGAGGEPGVIAYASPRTLPDHMGGAGPPPY